MTWCVYTNRVFELRHERQPKLDSWMSCRLDAKEPSESSNASFTQTFNAVSLPFQWQTIEPQHGQFAWDHHDRLVQWWQSRNLKIIGGPLIDFAGRNLPDWIWDNANDLTSLSGVLGEYVETVVRRYQPRIRTWQISAGSNCAGVLARTDAELIWLTLRLADAVRRVNPQLEIIVGIAQPWGDYLAEQERSKTPFIFADDLLRTGIKLAALELELIMGISPRGSYCRDLLDASRLLDLYALLGVPIQATLGYPSSATATEMSCQDQRVNLGNWRGAHSEIAQADWAAVFAGLALCKPFVRTVQWAHWSDAEPHQFPHCGLVNGHERSRGGAGERWGNCERSISNSRLRFTRSRAALRALNRKRRNGLPMIDDPNDPSLRSFIDVPADSPFPIQNLPFGTFRLRDDLTNRCGVAIGDHVLDISAMAEVGLFDPAWPLLRELPPPELCLIMVLGPVCWRDLRRRASRLLRWDNPELRDNPKRRRRFLVPQDQITMQRPAEIPNYTDFYSSREHATNVGIMLRGPDNALMPNWLHLPVAYHGRASSVVVSGTDITSPARPNESR